MEVTISHPLRPRYFTPAEANALLPELVERVRQAQALLGRGRSLVVNAVAEPSEQAFAAIREESQAIAAEMHALLEGLVGLGVQIEGIEPGCLDFPALRNGAEVLLCWKEGEERIEWWHPLDKGVPGREAIARTPSSAWEWCN